MAPTGQGKRVLHQISPKAWEHPADRAALATLQKTPGLPELTKKLIGVTTEKSLWLLHLASAVRVGTTQFPRVHDLYVAICERLDVAIRPPLFVSQNPFLNAGAIGADNPFIVVNSASLEAFSDAELGAILGHEVGHCESGHVLFKTLLQFLLRIPLGMIKIPGAGVALTAIIAALNEWDRKSELSADRAGLLATQEPDASFSLLMKFSGGRDLEQMDIERFLEQAKEYNSSGGLLGSVYKLLNVLGRSHPFPVTRLLELKTWVDSGAYERILGGEYRRRGEKDEDLGKEWKDAGSQFREDLHNSDDPLSNLAENIVGNIDVLAEQVGDIFGSILGKKKEK